ncbi:hypothetical protein [Methylobacterium tarhaniae]|uniref:hypothetical protein n=1 Tax=Methylobacterium tarhaniae TaxID=1187852 RepID=UPI0012EE5426|nr:hypothetical protein [Methylobacterium tarhaniae]
MSYDYACLTVQGMKLAVVGVADGVLESSAQREQVWREWQIKFGVPTAILGSRRHKIYGDRRITGWLSSINLAHLPWRRAT